MNITCHSLDQTLALGRRIGQLTSPPPATTLIALNGQLGAGKTHLVHGIAQGAGVDDPSLVSSPTYVLLNIYPGPKTVYHLDAYRIVSEEDFSAVGLEELLATGGIVVIEWAQRIARLLPNDRLQIELQPGDSETQRMIMIQGTGPVSRELAERVLASWP